MEYIDSLLIMEDSDAEDDSLEPDEAFAGNENDDSSSQMPLTTATPRRAKQSEPVPDWCKCNDCTQMPQEIENRCCGRRNCVTQARRFLKLCLDADVLEMCIRSRSDIRNDRENNSTSTFRKAAYRQYILEKYGYLGKGRRKVVPILCCSKY